ncbi:hypothetical protein SFRURICE_016477 [Spodoptera frugiperda]|nr:hypothetical protein SFRURICE_016477 [Spodoptera frugiperda]
MMHHPNMHHQPISGHPPQHMGGHQGMPAHHQMAPHQMHRENRHVTLTRVPLGPAQAGGAMGAHGQALGGLGAMGVPPPHHTPQRPPHPIRAMPHHPQAQHHSVPPQQMKALRRPYAVSGGYGPGAGVMPPPYAQPPPMQPPANVVVVVASASTGAARASGGAGEAAEAEAAPAPAPDHDDARDASPRDCSANSKEKTPMCLIKHQYRLTSETGPAHKKVFTVTLRLGDTEEYTAEGSSIKRAQHAAAQAALGGTSFPPPPPRAPAPHAAHHPHHRHAGAVMPTVELNALAMKLCQPAVYTSILGSPQTPRRWRRPLGADSGTSASARPTRGAPRASLAPRRKRAPQALAVGRAALGVGCLGGLGRMCLCERDGAARSAGGPGPKTGHAITAARARCATCGRRPTPRAPRCPPPRPTRRPHRTTTPTTTMPTQLSSRATRGDNNADLLNSEVKSPVSLVHELALKRNLSVQFTVKSERGPPHMRVFVTACTVGDMETEGEGNGKKVSKRRAAERMLEEMRRRWPPALLRARPPQDKRRTQPAKKKPRNLIKVSEEGAAGAGGAAGGADNPISRLAVARHAVRARSPQYRVLEERGAARRREFLVQCDAPPHSATGLGPNKKTAKRRAAHIKNPKRVYMNVPDVLLAMEMSSKPTDAPQNSSSPDSSATSPDSKTNDTKRKSTASQDGEAAGEVRQPVPGVLLMDYHQRTGQPLQPNGVSETSATGGSGGNTPGAKDQLMYLSQLLGFSVQFSDFPKRNHGEYLSLVSLSTEPPVMCHGGGPSTAHSHEQCSRAALRALTLMGLDAPTHPYSHTINIHTPTSSAPAPHCARSRSWGSTHPRTRTYCTLSITSHIQSIYTLPRAVLPRRTARAHAHGARRTHAPVRTAHCLLLVTYNQYTHSHEQCSRAALRALTLMGLDAPTHPYVRHLILLTSKQYTHHEQATRARTARATLHGARRTLTRYVTATLSITSHIQSIYTLPRAVLPRRTARAHAHGARRTHAPVRTAHCLLLVTYNQYTHSHEQCSRAALRALTLMGLDAPTHPIQSVSSTPAKTSVVSNGIAE